MNKDTLCIHPTAGNKRTDSNVCDITIEVHLEADYSDIEEFCMSWNGGGPGETKLDNLTKLISKRIK